MNVQRMTKTSGNNIQEKLVFNKGNLRFRKSYTINNNQQY